MSWIVKRALKLFLKDTGDTGNTSVRIMRGEVSFRAVALDEQVLAYFLGLPPNYVLRGVQCGVLHVRVPWMRMRHEPVVVRIEHLCAEVAEVAPGAAPPPEVPSKLAEWLAGVGTKDKKDKKKKKEKDKKKKKKTKKEKKGDDEEGVGEEGEEEEGHPGLEEMSAPKKKRMAQSMLEAGLDGLQVDVVGVLLTVSFAGGVLAPCATAAEHARAGRRPLPCATVAVGGLTVRTVNARREPTDMQRAYREATTADGTFTLRKEAVLTGVEVTLGRDRLLAVPSVAVLLTARRRPHDFVASEYMFDVTVPAVAVAFPGLAWHNLLGVVSDVRWSLVHAAEAAASKNSSSSGSGSSSSSRSGEARLETLRHGLDITDPLLSTSEATTVSESEATESVLGDGDGDGDGIDSGSDSEDVFGADERAQLEDIDIEALTRELGVDVADAGARSRGARKGRAAAPQRPQPVIQYSVYVNTVTAHLPRVLSVALTGLRVASTVELKPDSEGKDGGTEDTGAKGPQTKTRRRRRDQFVTSQVSSLSLASVAVSVDPGEERLDEAAATTFRMRGDARAPYFVEGTMEYRRYPRNRLPPETAVDLRVADIALVPRFADIKRAYRFFTEREWCSPPPSALALAQQQQQKEQQKEKEKEKEQANDEDEEESEGDEGAAVEREIRAQQEEEAARREREARKARSDKWVEQLTVRVATGDLLVGLELDSRVQICAHCKGVRVDAAPCDRPPQATYELETGDAARTESLTVVETPAAAAAATTTTTRKEEEEEEDKHPFQKWAAKVSDLWVGMEQLTSGERWYITEPFSLAGDFVVFDPVGVFRALQKKKKKGPTTVGTGTAGAAHQEARLPAICGRLALDPITLTLRQSVFTAAHNLFDYLMAQLEATLRAVERAVEARREAAAAESVRAEQQPLRKRLLALRRAVAQRLGGPAGVRFAADYTLARLSVALVTSNTSVKAALDRMDALALGQRHIGLALLSQVLRDVLLLAPALAAPLPEKPLVRATLRHVRGTVTVTPPPPPTVTELVTSTVRRPTPLPGTVPKGVSDKEEEEEEEDERGPDFFPREVFPDLDRETPLLVFTLVCSDYFIKADFAPAVLSLLALRPRQTSSSEQQEQPDKQVEPVKEEEAETGGKEAPEMIRESDLAGRGELRLTVRHWNRGRVFLDRLALAVSGAEACMRGVFPNQIVRVVNARNAELRRNKNAFVRAVASQRSAAPPPEQGTAAAVTLEQRFYATRFLAFDVEAADIVFQHTMPFDAPRNFTRVHVVPLGAQTLGTLRARLAAYLAAVDRANTAALADAYTRNAALSQALADAHRTLAALKVENATLQCAADEHAHALAQQRRARSALEARTAELAAALARADAALAARCPDVPVAEFRATIAQLEARAADAEARADRLAAELELARSELARLRK